MGLEGLNAILEKEEIVATQRADDLLSRPDIVNETYTRHVRTYIPFGRQASGGTGQSVTDFERQVIREVKNAGAVRGYITAEYGHGKTSTALYLWHRAGAENVLAIPPFQLNRLTDLIRATFGWMRYEIARTRPGSPLISEAEGLYSSLIERGAESLARQYNMSVADAQRMARERPEILEISPGDYIHFFEQMTRLAQESGYEGLLVIADELQQYIDPEVKAGIKDPVSPLFDVIGAILTRRKQLNFGLITVIPPKELGVLRDYRGDLIHRLLQVSLDLRTVYDKDFPLRLWQRLADEHSFAEHRDRIINQESLQALGQIGSRPDLSDGPRTVVNTLRIATRRYIEAGCPPDQPYTPETLVNDLLSGKIQYDSSKRIASHTARALGHSLVKGHPERERAIKWAAAFPNEGIPRSLQEELGLNEVYDELAQSALGDLIISVGDARTKGFTLRGLEEAPVETDWLSITVREFWRSYVETSDKTRQRAVEGFLYLLQNKAFPDTQWKVIEKFPERYTQNAGLLLEGAFNSSRQHFPDRRVHVRLVWEDEGVKDAACRGEVLVEITLRRHLDKREEERRFRAEPLHIDFEMRQIQLTINLMGRSVEISPQLDRAIGPIVSPFKLTPLLLLNLYQLMEEHRARNAIPKSDDQQIQHGFQLDLLDTAFRELFNETVGKPVDAAHERLLELALKDLLSAMYPAYKPLVVVNNWTSSLQKYRNALGNLESNYERQGQVVVDGTKDEIAQLFPLTNTGLDSFARNFVELIDLAGLSGRSTGVARFMLHPLESTIKKWLQESDREVAIEVGGGSARVHVLPQFAVYEKARSLGYLDKEIDAILELMEARGLTELESRRGELREAVTLAPSVDELETLINDWLKDLRELQAVFSNERQLNEWEETALKAKLHLDSVLRVRPDDSQLYQRKRAVQQLRHQLELFVDSKHQQLKDRVGSFLSSLPQINQQIKRRLETPIQGTVEYAYQVNAQLRAGLQRRYAKLENDIAQLQQRIEATKEALQGDSLDIETITRLAGVAGDYPTGLAVLTKSRDQFDGDYHHYADWVNLVEAGTRLTEELQQLGELVQVQNTEFQALSHKIRGHLSSSKVDALPDAPTYSIQLAELSESVRQLRADATQRFASLQDRYRQAIVQRLQFPVDRLWPPFTYNPVAPLENYERLHAEVQMTIQEKICDQLKRTLDKGSGSVRDTLGSRLVKTLPPDAQVELQRTGNQLASALSELTQRLAGVRNEADDIKVIGDAADEDGAFNRMLTKLSSVFKSAQELNPKVEDLNKTLQRMELSASEKMVLNALTTHTDGTDFGQLLNATRTLTEDGIWQALSGLHAKRRVRITLEPIRYD